VSGMTGAFLYHQGLLYRRNLHYWRLLCFTHLSADSRQSYAGHGWRLASHKLIRLCSYIIKDKIFKL